MKYCQNCGCENIETGKFCVDCGQPFDKITPVTPPAAHVADVAPSYSYAINAPVTDDTHTSSPSQYPLHTRPKQIYPITEEFKDLRASNGLLIFRNASLIYTLIPIILFVINLFTSDDRLTSIFTFMGLIALPIFTYGLYSFVNETPTEFRGQGSDIVKLLAAYCILSLIFFLISEILAPAIPTDPSSSELLAAANDTLLISLIGLIPEVVFLIGAIKFTEWFNEVVSRIGIYDSTTKFKWFGILKVTGSGTLILAFFFLLSQFSGSGSYETVLLAAFLLLISAITLLAGIIVQILAGYKIYKILKQAQYVN